MEGYLGTEIVNIKDTPYAGYNNKDWAMEYIGSYGQIDGAHHKQWLLDQVARILKDTPVIIEIARWDNGQEKHEEYRYTTGEPSKAYSDWVLEMKGEYDENYDEYCCSYDEGIAP